jgi:hypothetical protein
VTIWELLVAADTHWHGGRIFQYWDPRANQPLGEFNGDTLALFVVRELYEKFDPFACDEEQLAVAIGLIGGAIGDLLEVHRGLVEGLRKRIDTRGRPPRER